MKLPVCLCFFLLSLLLALPGAKSQCPDECNDCAGSDSGPCCGETVGEKTYCATYCLVEHYVCCGCEVFPDGAFVCGGCPKDTTCTYLNGTTPTTERIEPGSKWFCASGSNLSPSQALLVLALALAFLLLTMA
ncbi:hypothetical protein QOT17_010220 [Balamuthia mandrillaris]